MARSLRRRARLGCTNCLQKQRSTGVSMSRVLLACLLLAVSAPASSQSAGEVPRTPWGEPDLRGYWDYRTITPLERPSELADKAVLPAEEAARYEADANVCREHKLPARSWV